MFKYPFMSTKEGFVIEAQGIKDTTNLGVVKVHSLVQSLMHFYNLGLLNTYSVYVRDFSIL